MDPRNIKIVSEYREPKDNEFFLERIHLIIQQFIQLLITLKMNTEL